MPWEEELKINSMSQSGTIPSFEGWNGFASSLQREGAERKWWKGACKSAPTTEMKILVSHYSI